MRSLLYPALAVCVLQLAACRQAPKATPETGGQEVAAIESPESTKRRLRVVFLGNSLSSGYGLDPSLAFPALVQRKIDSLDWPVTVVNAGVSGETTAGGLSRIDWLLRDSLDVLVLELGGNDGLRGIAPEVTKSNLEQIIRASRARYADIAIVLAGMQVPPNMGEVYAEEFRAIYPEVAQSSGARLIPFLLDGVAGRSELNLADGIHPTAAGHEIVAETVWAALRPVLEEYLP